jgi:CDP-glucose 4,6-dehydratase
MKDLAEGKRPELRSNGRFTRDFLYIEDAVEIQFMLAERLAEDRSLYGEAFNFSYGAPIEVIEIVRRLAELTGQSIEPIVNESVRDEIPHMHLSCEKATKRLGWKPLFSLDEGLRRTVEWYSQYFKSRTSRVKRLGHGLIGVSWSALSEAPVEMLSMLLSCG